MTKNILGYVGTNYDPLLERYIGAQTVVETINEDRTYEYAGVLKEYSASYIEILDTCFVQAIDLALEPRPTPAGKAGASTESESLEARRGGIVARIDGGDLLVQNETSHPILLAAIRANDEDEALNTLIEPGRACQRPLGGVPGRVELAFKTLRQVDMVLPRSRALVRHRAERYRPSDAFGIPEALDLVRGNTGNEFPHDTRDRPQAGSGETSRGFEILLLQRDQIPEADKALARALQVREAESDEGMVAALRQARTEGEEPSAAEQSP